jgi:hypothetical protein
MALSEMALLAQVVQGIATIVGFALLFYQLRLNWRQATASHRVTMSQVYQNAASLWLAVIQLFIDHPEWKPYFYENKELEPGDDTVSYAQLYLVAELLAGFIEATMIHRAYMPEYQWQNWDKYLREIYANSPVLRTFLREKGDWFGDELLTLVKGYEATRIAAVTASTTSSSRT